LARDVDTDNPKSATGDTTSWNNDLENGPTTTSSGNNQNQDRGEQEHHAALGISMEEQDGHVHISAILPGSPAARAGLRVGDEIRSVAGEKIRTTDGLRDEIAEQRPGSRVELSIRRNGQRQTVQVRLVAEDELNGRQGRNSSAYGRDDGNRRDRQGSGSQFAGNGGQNGSQQNAGGQSGNRGRASSYDPSGRSMNEQLQALQQQVAQLQRQVDELRSQQPAGTTRTSNRASGQENE
jgi:membrane-associated protease RseP (regulator of RpoE activity)